MANLSRVAGHVSTELKLIALALVFGWLGAASLAWQQANWLPVMGLAALSTSAIFAHVWLNRVAPNRDPMLLPIVASLLAFGLLAIARVAPNFLPRQLGALAVATAAMLAIATSRDQLRWLRRFKYTWLLAAFILLIATLFLGVNPTGFGARLWLSVGGAFVQPSELLRLLVIAFLAAYFSERLDVSTGTQPASVLNLRSLVPTVAMWLIAVALLATQQDLGAATLLLLVFGLMLYLATGSLRLPMFLGGALLLAGGVGYLLSSRVAQRVDIWLNPWLDPQGSSFQVVQSLIAIASGGVFGQGINQGRPDYVPAVHTDFPYVMIAEEIGLIGALALIACYAALCLRAWHIARHASSAYRLLLAGGVAAAISVQVFIIVGGNMSLVPLTGVTLPFVSYGGTSLVTSFIAIGLLIRISNDSADVSFLDAGPRSAVRQDMRHALNIATKVSAGMFVLLALVTGLWSVLFSPVLTTREDNPRRVDAELALQRGSIYDRNGRELAASAVTSIENRVPRFRRNYPLPEAASAVGYYSQRYGVGGIEAFADGILRGQQTEFDKMLHRTQTGRPITLTLDANSQLAVQQALQAAIPNTVTRGAALVMDARTGQVLTLASAPSFDPNTLDDTWDNLRKDPFAPLVNRTTQGLYQPGDLLRWMIERTGGAPSADPAAFIRQLAPFALDKPVPFELQNQAVTYPVTATYSDTLGQGALRVTPLRVAVVAAQLVGDTAITPTLLLSATHATGDRAVRTLGRFVTFAPIAKDRVVGWLVEQRDERIIVVAIEMSTPDEAALRRVASAGR